VICGDFNTAHKDIDVAKPKEWSKVSGFLPEERTWLDKLFDMGYVDVFRKYNDQPEQYTYWDNFRMMRERNVGWRIDLFVATEETMPMIENCLHHPSVMGSDHCPIELVINP